MAVPYRAAVVGLSTSSTAAAGQVSSASTPVIPLSSVSGLANSSINTGAYPTYFPNYYALGNSFEVSALIVSTNGFQFEYTLDAGSSSPFISTAATWVSSGAITGSSSGVFISLKYPVTAIRLNVTAGSSTQVTLFTVLQSG